MERSRLLRHAGRKHQTHRLSVVLARLFSSPINQRAPDFTSLKLRNGTIIRKMAERKLGKRNGSHFSKQGGVKDADSGIEIEAVADLGMEKAVERGSMTIGKVFPGAQGIAQPIKMHASVIQTLPRWDPLESIGDRREMGIVKRDKSRQKSPIFPAMKWDHLLGVVRQMGKFQSSSNLLLSRQTRLHFKFPHLNVSLDNVHGFGSDDEPLHQYVINNLEKIASIDDALLFSIDKSENANLRSWTDKKLKADSYKKERSSKGSVDLLNPMNNPLLQDPDTSSPNGLNGYDKVMLKALRKASDRKNRGTVEISRDSDHQLVNAAERSILEFSKIAHSETVQRQEHTDSFMSKNQSPLSELIMEKKSNPILDSRKWGSYPGLDSNLAFSDFLEQFLEDEKCSHRVFMAWTTPSWTYTVRYQRGLESLLHFHPGACVVVFSMSTELDVFTSFVEQGFRVAVVVPNLEELLAGTPADIFSSFWLPWTKTQFFHIHYSELLRLAALYKYGGIYLDTDVVLLKPLLPLHNIIGAERSGYEARKLNGAVMAFDKNSVFLLECLLEFTETYDDQLLEFNGAGLVTRVADRMANKQRKTNEDHLTDVQIEEPHAFFPLTREDITRLVTKLLKLLVVNSSMSRLRQIWMEAVCSVQEAKIHYPFWLRTS
ncbi:hypothetical protein GOP47_0010790 [Adiantum capillus-veneris]|uniref:Alpha 1,4-glycosyltransferase domain-containing protein n=1 Tax=Adiantum capillus-veneris TaxID=13818 RepID=A0A9D4ZGR0_ADICA|nr:hypothetical protein GOP47_0010790 [Adiantum capillus-veneris]